MSGNRQIRATPLLDLGRVADAVTKAVRSAPRRKGRKPSLVVEATKKQRDDFRAKYVLTFDHVRYHVHPTGTGFEVWNVENHKIEATFPTLSRAKAYVEANS